jgi:hypothetical protein
MKSIHLASLLALIALVPLVQSQTFYSVPGEKLFPSSPKTWTSMPDGKGTPGTSKTYNSGSNELVIPEGSQVYSSRDSEDIHWNAAGYQLDGGTLLNRGKFAHFGGGDLTVTDKGFTFAHGGEVARNQLAGGVRGDGKLILGPNTLILKSAFTTASGIFEFGLPVVGDGKIDLQFSNNSTAFFLSELTPEFTGEIDGTRFEGIVELAPGKGASAANVRIGRRNSNKPGRLHLAGEFTVGALELAGNKVPEGSYSFEDLVAMFPEAAGHLIDGGGTITVGQPASN